MATPADPFDQALAETVTQVTAEESAGSTRAERAAGLAPEMPQRPQSPAASDAAAKANERKAALAALTALPPEVATAALVITVDLLAVKAAKRFGGPELGERIKLDSEEVATLVGVWSPIVAHYMKLIDVHPLWIAGGTTAAIYAVKVLPEGALQGLLGGETAAGRPPAAVPRAPAASDARPRPTPEPDDEPALPTSTAELIAAVPAPEPAVDPVIALANKKAAELKKKREGKEPVSA